MPTHDLRCSACGWKAVDVFVRVESLPVCSDCGEPSRIDWSHGRAPSVRGHGYGSFTPIDMGVLGKAETKEDYDRAVSTIQQRFPGHRVELTSETANKKKERMDGLRHRAYETRKKAGVDDTIRREMGEEARARKAEKAAAGPVAAPAGGAA